MHAITGNVCSSSEHMFVSSQGDNPEVIDENPPRPAQEWPNLFVVGAARAGTTSLWAYLDDHPEIFMSRLKEPHFFSRMHIPFLPYVHDEISYKALFANAGDKPFRGEASTSYLFTAGVAEAIADVQPAARIVISLRDPVERAYSQYWHLRRYGMEKRTFPEAVRAELERPDLDSDYVMRGRYLEQVRPYLHVFGDNVHVLVFEELAADTRREVRGLFEFLGVDSAVADSIKLARRNPGRAPRNAFVRTLYPARRVRATVERIVPRRFHARLEQLALSRSDRPVIDAESRQLLAEHYAAERAPLEHLLDRVLPWPRAEALPQE